MTDTPLPEDREPTPPVDENLAEPPAVEDTPAPEASEPEPTVEAEPTPEP
jgi:hypothetical protein